MFVSMVRKRAHVKSDCFFVCLMERNHSLRTHAHTLTRIHAHSIASNRLLGQVLLAGTAHEVVLMFTHRTRLSWTYGEALNRFECLPLVFLFVVLSGHRTRGLPRSQARSPLRKRTRTHVHTFTRARVRIIINHSPCVTSLLLGGVLRHPIGNHGGGGDHTSPRWSVRVEFR